MRNEYINNLYESMKYRYRGIANYRVNTEELDTLDSAKDLIAYMIYCGLENMKRLGLIKEYRSVVDEERSTVRGRINVSKTISKMSMLKGKVVCTYEVLTADVEFNQYIKKVTGVIIEDAEVSDWVRHKLAVRRQEVLGEVKDNIRVEHKQVRFNNMSMKYKPIIQMLKAYEEYRDVDESKFAYYLYRKGIRGIVGNVIENIELEIDEMGDSVQCENGAYSSVVKARNNSGDKQVVINFMYFSKKIEDDVFYEREQLENFIEQVKNIEVADGIKTTCAVIYILTDKDRYTLKESQSSVINDKLITTTVIDIKEADKFSNYKISNILKQDLGKRV